MITKLLASIAREVTRAVVQEYFNEMRRQREVIKEQATNEDLITAGRFADAVRGVRETKACDSFDASPASDHA